MLFNPPPLLHFFLLSHLICITEAGNHMARIADLTLQSQNFRRFFIEFILVVNLCYFLHAYLCLFVTICKFSPHSNGKRPLLYTDSRSHSASIYTTPICHTHHTSRASLPVAAGVFFKCVTLNKTFFVSRIVARLSLIPIALYLILPHGDVFNNRSRHPNSAALRFKWTQQITSSGLCNFWC